MSSATHKWYAVYLDRKQDNGEPDALFANEQDAYQWGFDNALYFVDTRPIQLNAPKPFVTERAIVWGGAK